MIQSQYGGDNNIIVEGHGRLAAAKQLGYKELDCIRLDHLTDEERRAYTLTHNKLTMNTDFDIEILDEELKNILNIDMNKFGFEPIDITEDDIKEDDFEFEIKPEEDAIAKNGYIYILGAHRVMCGDSTKLADVEKLMDGKTADLLLTDPPYNVDIGIEDLEDAKARKRRMDGKSIQNDKMTDYEFYEFLVKAFQNAEQILKPGGAFYVWYASREVVNFENALKDAGLTTKQELIWNKNVFVMGRQDYQWKHEPCLYGWKEGAAHYFIKDRTQKTVLEKEIDLDNMKKEDMRKLLEEILQEPTTVIDETRPRNSKQHPTMKPIKLMAKQIRNSTRPGEIVVDLFGGSGSTLIACEQLKRPCYIMEYDPHYVDVIVQRWEEETGQKAVLLNG